MRSPVDSRATRHQNRAFPQLPNPLAALNEWQFTRRKRSHFAQKSVNGGIVIWLCQTATNPAPAAVVNLTPVCPQSGSVSGHITSANVVQANTPPTQQLLAGELAEVIAAIRAGSAYANVHTSLSPGGEIRGQIRADGKTESGAGP